MCCNANALNTRTHTILSTCRNEEKNETQSFVVNLSIYTSTMSRVHCWLAGRNDIQSVIF